MFDIDCKDQDENKDGREMSGIEFQTKRQRSQECSTSIKTLMILFQLLENLSMALKSFRRLLKPMGAVSLQTNQSKMIIDL